MFQEDWTALARAEYFRALYVNPERVRITFDHLTEYDANIGAHSRRLRMTEEHGRTVEASSVPRAAVHGALSAPLL